MCISCDALGEAVVLPLCTVEEDTVVDVSLEDAEDAVLIISSQDSDDAVHFSLGSMEEDVVLAVSLEVSEDGRGESPLSSTVVERDGSEQGCCLKDVDSCPDVTSYLGFKGGTLGKSYSVIDYCCAMLMICLCLFMCVLQPVGMFMSYSVVKDGCRMLSDYLGLVELVLLDVKGCASARGDCTSISACFGYKGGTEDQLCHVVSDDCRTVSCHRFKGGVSCPMVQGGYVTVAACDGFKGGTMLAGCLVV